MRRWKSEDVSHLPDLSRTARTHLPHCPVTPYFNAFCTFLHFVLSHLHTHPRTSFRSLLHLVSLFTQTSLSGSRVLRSKFPVSSPSPESLSSQLLFYRLVGFSGVNYSEKKRQRMQSNNGVQRVRCSRAKLKQKRAPKLYPLVISGGESNATRSKFEYYVERLRD
jgi:hypothetical protein